MEDYCTWGTHVEIFALSLYFNKPVFVVLDKGQRNYYWAKMLLKQEADVVFPNDCQLHIQPSINHFELCHVNNNHYDISLSTDGSLSTMLPYQGSVSTSLAPNNVIIL